MIVKIDTKEKFHVLTLMETTLSENMTGEISQLLLSCREKEVKNVILNLSNVTNIEEPVAQLLLNTQQDFYEQQLSFVICEMKPEVEEFLDKTEILDLMNYTPSESEAWDIVQMEEIERELFEDE
nr:STAS domain-containing protein [uncultured Lacibacter sp.]